MNMLVAGGAQVMLGGSWHEQMGVTARDTGNAMTAQAVAQLSETINLEALRPTACWLDGKPGRWCSGSPRQN